LISSSNGVAIPKRVPLACLPTPLVEAPRLSQALGGPRILIKRDDLTGLGGGGNKLRGLEYYLADALEQGADVIVTGAGPQSNHIRATAAAARAAGLDIVAIMHDSPPGETQGNLLLDRVLGVETRFTNSPDRALVDRVIEETAAELRAAGRRPYVVPRGGASALGALGYVDFVAELNAQLEARQLRPDWLALATGACGTQAGLLAGSKIHGAPYKVVGFTVSRPVAECLARIGRLAPEAACLAGQEAEISPDEITVRDGWIGPGYGVPTPEGVSAIRLAARTEGLFLDPTYTGKALAGLIGEIRAGRIQAGETVVFLHTGGEPGLFAHPEIVDDLSG
jgi:D-cysteine desulfhydrase family pyridoxal phosphate-dependent enzyme